MAKKMIKKATMVDITLHSDTNPIKNLGTLECFGKVSRKFMLH
jgi:hypothetical protein